MSTATSQFILAAIGLICMTVLIETGHGADGGTSAMITIIAGVSNALVVGGSISNKVNQMTETVKRAVGTNDSGGNDTSAG